MYNKGTKLVFKCNGKLKQYHLDGSPKCDSPVLDGEAVTAEVKKRLIDMLQDKDQMRKAIEEYVGSLERRKEELETLLSPISEQISQLQEKQNVIIVGGGLVGCETGLHLAEKGKKVTIIDMLPEVAQDVIFMARFSLLEALKNKG